MQQIVSSIRTVGNERRAFFFFCLSLAAVVVMIVTLPDWLPLVGLLFVALLVYLAYRPTHGLYALAFLAPMSGLVVSFSNYGWARSIPYLGSIDAPLVDFFAILLFTAVVLRVIAQLPQRETRPIRVAPLVGFYALFLFANILSLAFGAQEDLVLQGVKFILRPIVFMYLMYVALPNSIIRNEDVLVRALRWFYAAGVIGAIIGLVSFLVVEPVQGLWHRATPFGMLGIAPFGYNHNLLAEVLVLMAPLGAYFVHRESVALTRKLYFLATAVMVAVALLTFARTAWIVFAVEFMLFAWVYREEIRHSIIMRSLRKVALLGLVLLLPLMVYMTAISTSQLVSGSTDTRVDLTRIAWEYFKRSPLVGNGPGSFIPIVADTYVFFIEYGDPLDAHGMLQKVIAENGIIGLITWCALLTALVTYLYHAVMRSRRDPLRVALFVMVVGGLVYQLFNTSYYNAKMWLPIGFALAGSQFILWHKNEKQKSST